MMLPSEGSGACREFRDLRRIGRRTLLGAGSLGMLGLGLPALWSSSARASTDGLAGLGRARRCIFLFMWGGPSQLDTFDMKPEAPTEIRGSFQSIATPVPGLQICEHFRHLAPLMDRVAVVRSLTHDDPAHLSSAHTVLTGHLAPVNKSDDVPPSERDTPHLGSVIARLRPSQNALPAAVTMPWLAYHPSAPGGVAPGQHGGWLGRAYDPLLVGGDPSAPDWNVPALALLDGLSSPRLLERRQLLAEIDSQRRALDRTAAASTMTTRQEQAFGLLASPHVRSAFDLQAEPPEVRDRFGRNIHGQCVLLARRLIERGVQLVSVNWHNDGRNFWDTHGDNFNRLQNDLIPPADQALAALLTDLEDRGLLEETLVVWVGEFGRRPQISGDRPGREHHPFCYSGLLAGGGIHGGSIYGRSDETASYPAENPVTPQDFNATVMHALGIPEGATLPDRADRPILLRHGRAIAELFG
jgi:hypothetical protein